jgi:signal transduction histidine kinase
MAPLAIVLVVIYIIAWSTYRTSKRAVSPVIWLASQVQRWDPKRPESSALRPENLPVDVEGETLVLASSLHDFASRIESFVERERDFTRDASHELRTPLTVIRVAGDMMESDESLTPLSRRALKRIQGAGRDMEALIEAFLILAREGDTGLPDDDFAVSDVVAEEVEKAKVLLAGKPVELALVQEADFHLHAPARVLSVLLSNLLRNACHYTDAGRVTVTLRRGSIAVSDTGVGMNPDELARVFEPFYRAGDRKKDGQGIGLSIVQRLSQRYGWPVTLESQPGQGTTATITFPAVPAIG